MGKKRSWTDEQLIAAVAESKSYRSVLIVLGLIPAGGNYAQVKRRIKELELPSAHFTGKGWNVGMQFRPVPTKSLDEIMVRDSAYQSHTLNPGCSLRV